MKIYIYSTLALIMVFAACKKENTDKAASTSEKLSHVTFNVGFAQSTGVFNVTNNANKLKINSVSTTATVDSVLKNAVDVIYANVYDVNGNPLITTTQLSTDTANFGKASFTLPPGNYTVVFAAGKTGLIFNSNAQLSALNLLYVRSIPNSSNYDSHMEDTFFKKISLTVGANGSIQSQNVELDRIVSEIIVNIEDAIPQNVKFICVQLSDDNFTMPAVQQVQQFNVLSGAPLTPNNFGSIGIFTPPTVLVKTGVKNMRFSRFMLNTNKPFTIRLLAVNTLQANNYSGFGFAGDAIADVSIKNVTIQTGHQTLVTGKLFGGAGLPAGNGFTIGVNPTWDPTPIIVPFQ
jgi:hypothetical protein